jgi:hypothetical protein
MILHKIRGLATSLICLCWSTLALAQLDSIHWLPPLHARSEWGNHFIYLSTPETDPFPVSICDGKGNKMGQLTISNAKGGRYDIGSGQNTDVLVPPDSLLVALKTKGIVLKAAKKFYANFRFQSDSRFQAGDLTCKGRSALGTTFRVGHFYTSPSSRDTRNNFAAVLATEDSTVVTLTASDPAVDLQKGASQTVGSSASILLNRGESAVFSQYLTFNAAQQPPNGLIGALVTSNKPIAVNVGSWLGAPEDGANDAGLDQIVPFEAVGTEYILCKGNGADEMENPMVVAHKDGTQVRINGSANPVAVLKGGQFYKVPVSSFTSSGNLHIETSEPAYMYQMVGGVPFGSDVLRTGGLIFVPPVSCAIPDRVDNIFQPNQIGGSVFDGGLMIVAMKDSLVELSIDGSIVSLGPPQPVTGNPDFVTYRRLDLFSENKPLDKAAIVAKGAVQVAMFGRNGAAGYGAFYSGFSQVNRPDIKLSIVGDGVCPDTLVASGRFDGVQWYFADSLLQYGPDSVFIAYSPGRYIARGYLGVCRRTGFAEDTVKAVFNSPEFPYTATDPSCFGTSDGVIEVGSPSGGLPPYQYSINKGASFGRNPALDGLKAGNYQLVVRDSTGCYNSPLAVALHWPDSLGVEASILNAPEPPLPGKNFILKAEPSRSVVSVMWSPAEDDPECAIHCTTFTVHPEYSTAYIVKVTDARGCTASDTILVGVQPKIYTPNVLKTGASNGNDRLVLSSRDVLPVHWLRIYDRWGELLFERKDITTNDADNGWDARFRNRDVPPGVYVFMAMVEYLPGRTFLMKGDVTVVR